MHVVNSEQTLAFARKQVSIQNHMSEGDCCYLQDATTTMNELHYDVSGDLCQAC